MLCSILENPVVGSSQIDKTRRHLVDGSGCWRSQKIPGPFQLIPSPTLDLACTQQGTKYTITFLKIVLWQSKGHDLKALSMLSGAVTSK
jgi:hypothetical protein